MDYDTGKASATQQTAEPRPHRCKQAIDPMVGIDGENGKELKLHFKLARSLHSLGSGDVASRDLPVPSLVCSRCLLVN